MNVKSIIINQTVEYGYVRVKLADVMKSHGITRNGLRTLTGVKYSVIDQHYKRAGYSTG